MEEFILYLLQLFRITLTFLCRKHTIADENEFVGVKFAIEKDRLNFCISFLTYPKSDKCEVEAKLLIK